MWLVNSAASCVRWDVSQGHLTCTFAAACLQNLDGKCARELATSDAVFELLDEPKTAFTY